MVKEPQLIREIVLDTETTGLDPIRGKHRITEISCLELINHIPTGKHFQTYLNPEREVDPGAQRITGHTWAFLKDKPLFKDKAQEFLDFIQNDILVIHNASFDLKFLNFELMYAGFEPLDNEVVDTLPIARAKFPGAQANLDALCKRFGVNNQRRVKHGALIDCELLAEVYLALIGGPQKQLFDGSDSDSDIGSATTAAKNIFTSPFDSILVATKDSRNFSPSEVELAAHDRLIQEIPSSLWEKP